MTRRYIDVGQSSFAFRFLLSLLVTMALFACIALLPISLCKRAFCKGRVSPWLTKLIERIEDEA